VSITIKPLGKRPDYFGGEFEATEIRHEPTGWDTWPTGPVFPEGHIFQDKDGNVYEVVVPRTVQEQRMGDPSSVRYIHVYTCRPADPRDAA
jgi:hypothetical protein